MCSVTRRDEDAASRRARSTSSVRERPPGARHLGAARLVREDGLVGVERPRLAGRSRSGSAGRGGEVVVERRVEVEPCDPEPVAAGVAARASSARRAAGQLERGTDSAGARKGAPVGASAARRPSGRRRPAPASRDAARPAARRGAASSAAGSVAEVLTTSRSPGARNCGRSPKRACDDRAVVRARRRAARRRRGRARAPRAARAPPSAQRRAASALTPRTLGELAGAVAAARQSALDQREQARARSPRAAAGRRCPRPGTPPGASACACRPGRPCRRAARVLGGEDRRRAARARPSTSRSRPSPRTARPRRPR